jgi:hypothetical protein
MKLKRRSVVISSMLWLLILLITACQPTPPDELQGGALATFAVHDETFRVWVTNAETIQQLIDLQEGRSQANIPNGEILRSPGEGDHNEPWSWHLHPENIEMAEVTMELCDGLPSFVEEELDMFVEQVGRYCPWAADLVNLEDRR